MTKHESTGRYKDRDGEWHSILKECNDDEDGDGSERTYVDGKLVEEKDSSWSWLRANRYKY